MLRTKRALGWAGVVRLGGAILATLVCGLAGCRTIPRPEIVFHTDRDGAFEIYGMNRNGQAQVRLTRNNSHDADPALSPGRWLIAFNSERDGNREIYVMRFDGRNQRRLTFNNALDSDPAWSRNGSRLAWHRTQNGNTDIYMMSVAGGPQTRLTQHAAKDGSPSWGPQNRIAFSSDRTGKSQIFVINASGTGLTQISGNQANDWNPEWSPNGQWILYTTDEYGDLELWRMRPNGNGRTRLTTRNANGTENSGGGWVSSNVVAFRSNRTGDNEVFRMHWTGAQQQNLTQSKSWDSLTGQ